MKFRNILLASAAVLFCTASLSATAIEHTWVSGSGSDSNACTFASPCLTFQGALAKTTAGGVITAKDAGDFRPVIINQAVTIDGNNLGSITFSNETNIGIEIDGGANVTVRSLNLNGLGSGTGAIAVESGGIVIIDNCNIENFTFYGIDYSGAGKLTVENSRIESSMIGSIRDINIAANAAENVVIRNTVLDASPATGNNSGIIIDQSTGPIMASLQNVTITDAGNTAFWVGTGTAQITGSVITQSNYGVYADYGATISVASSLITNNVEGVCSNASSKIRLDNNDIYDNTTAIGNCGGIVKTSTTNKTSGTIAIPAADVSDSVTF